MILKPSFQSRPDGVVWLLAGEERYWKSLLGVHVPTPLPPWLHEAGRQPTPKSHASDPESNLLVTLGSWCVRVCMCRAPMRACPGTDHPQIVYRFPTFWRRVGTHPLPLPARLPARPAGTHHLLGLAEVDVLLAPAARPGVLDVREADEGHGAAAQQQDGEEHDADGGGADELPLLHGLQVQVQAQGVGDGPPQAWATVKGVRGTEAGGRGQRFSGDLGPGRHHGCSTF